IERSCRQASRTACALARGSHRIRTEESYDRTLSFWRVTMFQLKSLRGLRWTAGLLSLAVTVSGLGVAAAASDEPKQEEKKAEQKKESPKKDKIKKELPDKNTPNFEDVFKNVPQGVDPEQMRQFQREMQRMMEQMRQQFQPGGFPQGGFQGGAGFQGGPYAAFMRNREGR